MRARLSIALCAIAVACSDDSRPALIFEIRSPLAIPAETNVLAARVMNGEGAVLREETYPLGTPPRDRWPQILPILRGETAPADISLVLELRRANNNAPADVVGFAVAPASFPGAGERTVMVEVPRACADADNDGFGFGVGCRGLDCDDRSPSRPDPSPCETPDAGVPDAAPPDAAQQPPDAGPVCGDAGVVCPQDETCFAGACRDTCEGQMECPDQNQLCLPPFDVCFCRYPCSENTPPCGGVFACLDGCCQLN